MGFRLALVFALITFALSEPPSFLVQDKHMLAAFLKAFRGDLPKMDGHLLIIGDSTMSRLFDSFKEYYPRVDYRTSGHCDLNQFFNFTKADPWLSPSSDEGPCNKPITNCQDCHGCNHRIHPRLEVGVPSVEYLGIEFARDVEIQTPKFSTTQENLINLFLKPRYASFPSLTVIVNSAIHDAVCASVAYETNVRFLLALLKSLPNANVIWLGIANTLGQYTQTHQIMTIFNNISLEVARELRVVSIDIFQATSAYVSLLLDNVHFDMIFYRALTHLICDFLRHSN